MLFYNQIYSKWEKDSKKLGVYSGLKYVNYLQRKRSLGLKILNYNFLKILKKKLIKIFYKKPKIRRKIRRIH